MKKLTNKEKVLRFLKEKNDWVMSFELVKVDTPHGWIGTSGDRMARALRDEGLVISIREGKYEKFKYSPSPEKYKKIEYRIPELSKIIIKYVKI